jgi:mRNA interferase MazF
MCKRGDIYYAKLPVIENSRIQQGVRPILLISNQKAIDNSPVFQYIPLTSQIKKPDFPVHFILTSGDLDVTSMALTEQIGIIDKHRLLEKRGTVSEYDMKKINRTIRIQLDLDDEEENEQKYAVAM